MENIKPNYEQTCEKIEFGFVLAPHKGPLLINMLTPTSFILALHRRRLSHRSNRPCNEIDPFVETTRLPNRLLIVSMLLNFLVIGSIYLERGAGKRAGN